MRWQTHVAAGMAAAGAICQIAEPTSIRCCTLILGTVIGSLLPDIDCSGSKIATSTATTSCISVLLEDGLGHRGIIHTPFTALLLSGTLLYWYSLHLTDGWSIGIAFLGAGIVLGFLIHLLLDMFTPYGIMLMYPFTKKRVTIDSNLYGATGESHLFSILFLLDVIIYVLI